MRHDWPAKKAFVDLPIKMKGNSKRTSGNSLSPLGAQNKDIGAASRTLLTEVKLHLRRRLSRLATSRPLGERSEIRRRTFLKV